MITTVPRPVAPGTTPWASLIDDETREVRGAAMWCCACESWIDVLDENCNKGAVVNAHGDWRCFKCGVERRAIHPRPAADSGPVKVSIPEEYADASIEHVPSKQRTVARQWPTKKPFMVISGIPGAGKTRLTWAYVKQAAQQGKRVMRLEGVNMQRAWSGVRDNRERLPIQNRWEEAAYLIVDDLSACEPTDAWVRVIHALLEIRRTGKRPMLITTAAGPEEFRRVYNEAIHSRMVEFEWIYLPPKDWRAESAAKFQLEAPATSR